MYKDRDSRDVIIRNLIADLDFAYEHIQATSSTGQRDAHALGRRRAQVARLPLRSGLPPLPQPHGA